MRTAVLYSVLRTIARCTSQPEGGARETQPTREAALARQLKAATDGSDGTDGREIDGSDGGHGARPTEARSTGATVARERSPQFLENANHGGNAAQISFSEAKAATPSTGSETLMETETAEQMDEDEWMQQQRDEKRRATDAAGWSAGKAAASTDTQ